MNSQNELFKADGEENIGEHFEKYHIGKVFDLIVKPIQWWNLFNGTQRWYCKNCKMWL